MKRHTTLLSALLLLASASALLAAPAAKLTYPIVDTGQIRCYNSTKEIAYPKSGAAFSGQDAQTTGNAPRYRDNKNGTVSDLVTGLIWQQDPGKKMTLAQRVAGAKHCRVGGHRDWRLPTIKELYSLIQFCGEDLDPRNGDLSTAKPFIDPRVFKFTYGQESQGERTIDSQFATCTKYVSTTMGGNETMFGVNFADGRIKGYPAGQTGRKTKTYYVLYVRGNCDYGKNRFVNNTDGTITDQATGLTWMQVDSGALKAGRNGAMNWQQALKWAEGLTYAGKSDWRLPNIKELQSIVDYARSPDTTNSPAINPIFKTTAIKNGGGKKDYPFFWSSTTHVRQGGGGTNACYIAFGRANGWMGQPGSSNSPKKFMDVHGAGAQRSDPKTGTPAKQGRGPQGDEQHIYNYVRCVRGGVAKPRTTGPKLLPTSSSSHRPEPGGNKPTNDDTRVSRFVGRLDKNGDGKVSKAEFDGPSNHFGHLDKNSDGFISADEAPAGPPQGGPPQRRGRQ